MHIMFIMWIFYNGIDAWDMRLLGNDDSQEDL